MGKENLFNRLDINLQFGKLLLVNLNISAVVAFGIDGSKLIVNQFSCKLLNMIVAILLIGSNIFILAEVIFGDRVFAFIISFNIFRKN